MRHLLLLVVAAVAPALGAQTAAPLVLDSLRPRHAVSGNTVRIDAGGLAAVEVDRAFRYVGGHRFILAGVADAEQHAFVVAGADGTIERFYWIQLEQYLPSAPRGSYDYSTDSLVVRDGREWRVQVRQYASPAVATSDRGALQVLFGKMGLRAPLPAHRVRLVHLTSPDRRSELMIIYAEAAPGPLEPDDAQRLIKRAQAGLTFIGARR